MKKSFIVFAMIGSLVILSGCNTVAGLGEDLKKGSEHVSEAIDKVGNSVTQKANEQQ